jgi:hypothetical protein
MNQQEQMRSHLLRWRESGQSIASYCRVHKIEQYTFHYWRDKLMKTTDQAPEFITLGPERDSPAVPLLAIRYPNGVCIEVPQGSSIELLRSLIYL